MFLVLNVVLLLKLQNAAIARNASKTRYNAFCCICSIPNTANTVKNALTLFIFCEKDISNHVQASEHGFFLFLGIKTSAFTACVLSNLLRNRTVKELYFLLIRCLFLLLFRCPLRAFRHSMCAAKADTCVRIPTHKALQTHQFRQCRARADKAAIAFPYGKDFLFACSVKLTAKPYHERNILFVTPILAPAYP